MRTTARFAQTEAGTGFPDLRNPPGTLPKAHATSRRTAAGFTITELLVAIAVLVIVIAGTSKIFGTASQVTGLAQANQDVLQESAAIEQRIREDLERLSKEGFFAIHCVAVRNDVNGAVLLNPNLPPDAILRADQLVFFANGVEGTQTFHQSSGSNHKGQSTVARVYYGPAYQLPRGQGVNVVGVNNVEAHDADLQAGGVGMTPWWNGACNMVRTLVQAGGATGNFSRTAVGVIDGHQPEARKWLLARQCVPLLDDDTTNDNDNSKTVYLQDTMSARSIFFDHPGYGWTRELRNGRVDAAATLPNEIRRWVTFSGTSPAPRPWFNPGFASGDQKTIIRSAVYYPRAERIAPSTHRVDQALTNAVISSACSSFIVDWTYEGSDDQRIDGNGNIVGGVGEVLDAFGNVADPTPAAPNSGDELSGVVMTSSGEQMWFGFDDPARGVFPYATLPATGTGPLRAATTILPVAAFPNNIESESAAGTQFNNAAGTIKDYWAVFGYNQTRPLNDAGVLDASLGYTPWPTALRITMTLHDPGGRMEAGREVQFIIHLPRRHD